MVTDNSDTRPRNGPNGLNGPKKNETIKMVTDNSDTRPRNGPNGLNGPNGPKNQDN